MCRGGTRRDGGTSLAPSLPASASSPPPPLLLPPLLLPLLLLLLLLLPPACMLPLPLLPARRGSGPGSA